MWLHNMKPSSAQERQAEEEEGTHGGPQAGWHPEHPCWGSRGQCIGFPSRAGFKSCPPQRLGLLLPQGSSQPPLQKEKPWGSGRAPGLGWVSLMWRRRPSPSTGTAVTGMEKEGVLAVSCAYQSGKLVAVFSS